MRMKKKLINQKINELQKLADEIIQNAQTHKECDLFVLRQDILYLLENSKRMQENSTFLVECFSLIYRVVVCKLKIIPYREQIISALALLNGYIVEYPTGEGKTLVITFTGCIKAIMGHAVHIFTVNEYLAQRDAQNMSVVYEMFGLTVSNIYTTMSNKQKKDSYNMNIVYSSAKEIAFDFLRDQSTIDEQNIVQGNLDFAILDEVDSILIDEAQTPLVLSGRILKNFDIKKAEKIMLTISKLKNEIHYYKSNNEINLTDLGIDQIELDLGIENLFEDEQFESYAWVESFLKAFYVLEDGVDYIKEDNSIKILDKYTDRVVIDKQWADLLQMAVEMKEKVELTIPFSIVNRIDFYHFLKMYNHFTGITGTAADARNEFKELYGKEVLEVPPHIQSIRDDWQDKFFLDKDSKIDALKRHIMEVHKTGQPVLLVTESVSESEMLFEILRAELPTIVLLNAKNEEEESGIILKAGCLFAVTVTTHMAGRGVDIPLDEKNYKKAINLGGLHIISTNHFECARIDKQIRGRAGRNGEPGSSCFFISLEDPFFYHLDEKDKNRIKRAFIKEKNNPEFNFLNRYIELLQNKSKLLSFDSKKTLFKYSEIIEETRVQLAEKRKEILTGSWSFCILEKCDRNMLEKFSSILEKKQYDSYRKQIELYVIYTTWSEYLESAEILLEEMPFVASMEQNPLEFFNLKMMAFQKSLQNDAEQMILCLFKKLLTSLQKSNSEYWDIMQDFGASNTKTYIIKKENEFEIKDLSVLAFNPVSVFAYMLGLIIVYIKRKKKNHLL